MGISTATALLVSGILGAGATTYKTIESKKESKKQVQARQAEVAAERTRVKAAEDKKKKDMADALAEKERLARSQAAGGFGGMSASGRNYTGRMMLGQSGSGRFGV
tara:strand:- start:998 stop:1315 length:318 start_codon:yes stop_codon:yes gene_type:complete